MELEELKKQLYKIAEKVTKKYIDNSNITNEIQKGIHDSIIILSTQISAEMICEYEKLKQKNT